MKKIMTIFTYCIRTITSKDSPPKWSPSINKHFVEFTLHKNRIIVTGPFGWILFFLWNWQTCLTQWVLNQTEIIPTTGKSWFVKPHSYFLNQYIKLVWFQTNFMYWIWKQLSKKEFLCRSIWKLRVSLNQDSTVLP